MIIKTAARPYCIFCFRMYAPAAAAIISQRQLLCTRCLHQLPLTYFHLYTGNPVERSFTEGYHFKPPVHGFLYTGFFDAGAGAPAEIQGQEGGRNICREKIGEALGDPAVSIRWTH